MTKPQITVIGAGFSGLVTAYYLVTQRASSRFSVRVIESSPRAGGLLQTVTTPNGLVERAANGVIASPGILRICETIGVKLESTLPQARNRYIFRDGKPRRWPLTIGNSLKLAASVVSQATNIRPTGMETIREWGNRVLGAPATKYLLVPGLSGIYAGDPDRLSASLILRKRVELSKDDQKKARSLRPRTLAPRRGMQALIDGLVNFLKARGVEIVLDTTAAVEPGAPTIICTSAPQAARLLAECEPEVGRQLEKVEMLPLLTATCFFERRSEQPQGFGCLFPRNEGFRALGVLFNDCIFPERSAKRSETWIFGGALDRSVIDLTDEQIVAEITKEHQKLTLSTNVPIEAIVTRWPRALPHYTTDLELMLNHRAILPGEILLVGNYLGAIGLTRIVELARHAAMRMCSFLG